MSIKAYQIQVFGKVQRVGFRFYVQKGAEIYNVKGFAKNMADGSVFIEAEGDAEDMDTFKDYCKKGPDWSNVTGFQANEIPPAGYNQFEIKH